ncbi:MAG: serine/threonine-protein kinase [Acidobacteriota bacterium]
MSSEKKIGKFDVLKVLGKGGMGLVYLAKDPHIERLVAIKTINIEKEMEREEWELFKSKFFREARAAGNLIHPNIVTIFEAGELKDMPYIAMEYIKGKTLKEYIDEKERLEQGEVINFMIQACNALEFAHKNNIIHRDIKPANMMVTDDNVLKIADFGLAKDISTSLEKSGKIFGSPKYMSPEQIKGEKMDGRTDIFSLGIVMYQLLTGKSPFEGESISQVIFKILNTDPPFPDQIRKDIPKPLAEIVMKAIRKNPDDRFSSAAELRRALQNAKKMLKIGGETTYLYEREIPRQEKTFLLEEPEEKRKVNVVRVLIFLFLFVLIGSGTYLVINKNKFFPGEEKEQARGTVITQKEKAEKIRGDMDNLKQKPMVKEGISPVSFREVKLIPDDSDSLIFIDGKQIEGNILKISGNDKNVHIVKAVSKCKEGEIKIDPAELKNEYQIPQNVSNKEILVSSTPPGAKIYVNDRLETSLTPARLSFTLCENYKIRVEKENFNTYSKLNVSFTSRDKDVFHVSLIPIQELGRLMIESRFSIKVYVDDKLFPLNRESQLSLGTHNVRIIDESIYYKYSFDVDIESKDSPVKWNYEKPQTGFLELLVRPENAKILIDDFLLKRGAERYIEIAVGDHVLKCTWPESSQTKEKIFRIRAGKTERVTIMADTI